MGEFSVSGIREELDSPELGRLFNRLKADCSYLGPFADWKAVIALLHDTKRGYRLKDRILWRLIQYYRQGGDNDRLGTVFIAIFTPAIGDIYRRWCGRRKPPRSGDDLSQEICLTLLAILKEIEIDKNLLFVAVSIRSMALCVKNILPQDVVCGANEHGEGVFRPPYFEENFSPFGFVTCKTGIFPGIQADLSVTP